MYSLTVGGGYGFLTGRHGLTIDNLVNAVVVLANGDIVKANAEETQDVVQTQQHGHQASILA
jgi:FAD/FMN-containing dehydrogenase